MVRYTKKTWGALLVFTLMVLLVIVLAASSTTTAFAGSKGRPKKPTPTPTPAPDPDFSFKLNLPSSWDGYLVRGGLHLSNCPHCVNDAEPRYSYESYGSCFYDSNTLNMVSLNGFEGTVTLEVLNLPPGVTSEMPGSIFVPSGGVGSTRFALRATADAALQNATVTLRGTSGTIVHTLEAPIVVADLLPPCLNGNQISVQGGNPVEWTVTVGGPVAVDTIVSLTSSHPTVAWVPGGSVTIPAGSSEVPITVDTNPVNQRTDVTITASVNGFSHDKVLSVNP